MLYFLWGKIFLHFSNSMYFWLEVFFHVVFHLRLVLQLYVISLIDVSAALVILINPLLIV